ncbi:MAG: acylphosphatase [Methanoregulaceae archaeon]|nr:acylphosphatase [Methanoregulaceae archaeon]
MKTVEITISGRVQKVGFRACVRKVATDLSVTGTVFNLPDGRVQVYATAEPMILEKFISSFYGCPRAVIRDVKVSEIPHKVFEGFCITKNEGRISTGL